MFFFFLFLPPAVVALRFPPPLALDGWNITCFSILFLPKRGGKPNKSETFSKLFLPFSFLLPYSSPFVCFLFPYLSIAVSLSLSRRSLFPDELPFLRRSDWF